MTVDARFFSKVRMTSGCWVWTAALGGSGHQVGVGFPENWGYGKFWDGERLVSAHRFAYEQMVGPIPEGLDIDHLCRNRRCVRPDHMEPVSRRINTLRGNTLPAENATRTHCPEGHPYDDTNTRVRVRGGRRSRECRTCSRARCRKVNRRRRDYMREYNRKRRARMAGAA